MPSKLFIKAEAAPGDDIEEVIRDAVSLASRMDVCIEVNINGVTVFAKPTSDAADLIRSWEAEIGSGRKQKFTVT